MAPRWSAGPASRAGPGPPAPSPGRRRGPRRSVAAFDHGTRALVRGIIDTATLCDVDRVVIGGGVAARYTGRHVWGSPSFAVGGYRFPTRAERVAHSWRGARAPIRIALPCNRSASADRLAAGPDLQHGPSATTSLVDYPLLVIKISNYTRQDYCPASQPRAKTPRPAEQSLWPQGQSPWNWLQVSAMVTDDQDCTTRLIYQGIEVAGADAAQVHRAYAASTSA